MNLPHLLYYIYSRLNAHVGWDDDRLMAELDEWADSGLKAGREDVTDELRIGIRAEHDAARELYATVMGGCI